MLVMVMQEVLSVDPRVEVRMALELSGPRDQVIAGRGDPTAVQHNCTVSPSVYSFLTVLEGFVMDGLAENKNHT